MRKMIVSVSFLFVTAGLSGCVPSIYPLYTEKDLRFDPALIGTWAERPDAAETWTFTKADDSSYALVYKDHAEEGSFEAHLLQLGKFRFIDIAPTSEALKGAPLPDLYKVGLIPGHMFLKVTQIEPVLKMTFLDPDWLGKRLEADPKDLAHSTIDRGHGEHDLFLLAPTRDLQAFMLKHADDPAAFGESSEMKRVK